MWLICKNLGFQLALWRLLNKKPRSGNIQPWCLLRLLYKGFRGFCAGEIASKQSTTILKLFCPCPCIACIERCFFTPWVSRKVLLFLYWCFKKEIAKSIWGMAWCKLRNVMLDIIHKWLSNMLPLSAITEKYRCGKKNYMFTSPFEILLSAQTA